MNNQKTLFNENYKYAMENKNFLLLTNKELAILLEQVSNANTLKPDSCPDLLRRCIELYGNNMFVLDLVSASAQRFCELMLCKSIK